MCVCIGYIGADQLGAALKGCEVVVIPAGVPRKPGVCVFLISYTDLTITES